MEVAINIPNVILATLVLVLIMASIVALFVGGFWLIYKGWKALSQRQFYVALRRRQQKWWNRHKGDVIRWWELVTVLSDPVFYGYVLVTLYQRVQAISEYAKTYPQYSFWQLLNVDTETHMQYYTALAIIFIIWLLAQVWKHNKKVEAEGRLNRRLDGLLKTIETRDNQLSESIKQNSKDISKLTRNINKLATELKRNRLNRGDK